ncbi:hypothetical protein GLE_1042 [Lysobacter enzymogenes]|uniref:Uncharacterized protein n=1 Tax=Lysobacter enzymogenes TaxID=69 RepID=A0A0S2DD13_LYSEN|nr:hypothetical protein GLE_1042 [Lysobacter enzymogenes]
MPRSLSRRGDSHMAVWGQSGDSPVRPGSAARKARNGDASSPWKPAILAAGPGWQQRPAPASAERPTRPRPFSRA